MSGARLQALGQVRNVYPFIVSNSARVSLAVPVSTFLGEIAVPMYKADIPFDLGPDKSGRVFVTLNGVHLLLSVDAGTTTRVSGFLYYRIGGRKTYIVAIASTLATSGVQNIDTTLSPNMPIMAESVDNIGYFGFENAGSAAGTAATITFDIAANFGLYGDYAEPDWNTLFKQQVHEHYGVNELVTINDDR